MSPWNTSKNATSSNADTSHAMTMKPWKQKPLNIRRRSRTCFIGVLVALTLVYWSHFNLKEDETVLFIAVGTKPTNFGLRAALRRTWLSWTIADPSVKYRFFTEADGDEALEIRLRMEMREYDDIELQALRRGYRAFAARGILQMRWALRRFPKLQHYLRVDDDTFLCFRKLRWELAQRPNERFFWGKYFCRAGKHCADENFMLFSTDVVRTIISGVDTGALPVHWNNTLARNFGLWSRRWPHLTIFDDRSRFDVQQGLLTKYMHERVPSYTDETYAQFCQNYIFAHWVKSPLVMDNVHRLVNGSSKLTLPRITSNIE
eukprot:IDg16249t1